MVVETLGLIAGGFGIVIGLFAMVQLKKFKSEMWETIFHLKSSKDIQKINEESIPQEQKIYQLETKQQIPQIPQPPIPQPKTQEQTEKSMRELDLEERVAELELKILEIKKLVTE